jgi:hypothetical protein
VRRLGQHGCGQEGGDDARQYGIRFHDQVLSIRWDLRRAGERRHGT